MKAVAYVRVSDLSQVEGHSLEAQERLYRELCTNRGWEPSHVYREEGKSAHTDSISKRSVFQQLLNDAGQGRFDTIVVHTLDRWSRNLRVTLVLLALNSPPRCLLRLTPRSRRHPPSVGALRRIGLSLCGVDGAIGVFRRRIDRVELQFGRA